MSKPKDGGPKIVELGPCCPEHSKNLEYLIKVNNLINAVKRLAGAYEHDLVCRICCDSGCDYCHSYNAVEPCNGKKISKQLAGALEPFEEESK